MVINCDFCVYKTGNICYNSMIIQWIIAAFCKKLVFLAAKAEDWRYYVKYV